MKRLLYIALFCMPFIISCKSDLKEGKWGDIIKFNTKEASFGVDGGTKIITSKGDWWWILPSISVGKDYISLENNPDIEIEMGKAKGWDNPNVIYDEGADMEIKKITGEWYTITKDTYKSLIIETKPNETALPRSFVLHIEAGNYFDYITVSQSSK